LASRKQIWEWKRKNAIPKPKTLKNITDKQLREEMAIVAISHYLPFISKESLLKEIEKEKR